MIPMEMTAPAEGMNSNILAGLTGDILKKVTKNIIDTTSQHASDAINQGVPYGHVLEQLLKMAPPGANLMGGGAPPPGGPMGDGGGPPPKGPAPMAKRAEGDVAMVPTQQAVPTQPDVPQQQQQPQSQDILTALLASMQGGGRILPTKPGFMNTIGSDNQLMTNGDLQLGGMFPMHTLDAMSQAQQLTGRQPMQISELQKMIAGVGAEKMKAEVVPPTQQEKLQNQAAGFTAQLTSAQDQLKSAQDEQEKAIQSFNAMAGSRGMLGKQFEPKDLIAKFKTTMKEIETRRKTALDRITSLSSQHPSFNIAKYSAGETRNIGGVTYKRKGDGTWQAQS